MLHVAIMNAFFLASAQDSSKIFVLGKLNHIAYDYMMLLDMFAMQKRSQSEFFYVGGRDWT